MNTQEIVTMAHLGAHAFEAIGGEVVQTTSFAMRNIKLAGKGVYFRLVDSKDKELDFVNALTTGGGYLTDLSSVEKIPGKPFAYWVSTNFIDLFNKSTLKELADPRKGIVTMNDDLFIRLWHEVALNDIYFNAENIIEFDMSAAKYAPIKCGGGFRKWYGNKFNVIKWQNNGKEIKTYITEVSGDHYSRQIFNQDRFFCESLTWNSIASNNVCFRYHEEGALFGSSGPSMFPADHKDYILALLNTNVAYHIIKLINPSQNLGPSVVSKLPFVLKNEERVKEISCNNVAISKEDWDSFETSWDFKKHPLI